METRSGRTSPTPLQVSSCTKQMVCCPNIKDTSWMKKIKNKEMYYTCLYLPKKMLQKWGNQQRGSHRFPEKSDFHLFWYCEKVALF